MANIQQTFIQFRTLLCEMINWIGENIDTRCFVSTKHISVENVFLIILRIESYIKYLLVQVDGENGNTSFSDAVNRAKEEMLVSLQEQERSEFIEMCGNLMLYFMSIKMSFFMGIGLGPWINVETHRPLADEAIAEIEQDIGNFLAHVINLKNYMLGGFNTKEWLALDNADVNKLYEALWSANYQEQTHYQFSIHKTKASLDEIFEALSKDVGKITSQQLVEYDNEKEVDFVSCITSFSDGAVTFTVYQTPKDQGKTNCKIYHNRKFEFCHITHFEKNIPVAE